MKSLVGLEFSFFYVVLIRASSAIVSIFLMIHLSGVNEEGLYAVLKVFSLAVGLSLFSIYGYNQMILRLAPTMLDNDELGSIKKILVDSLLTMLAMLFVLVSIVFAISYFFFEGRITIHEAVVTSIVAACLSLLMNMSALLRAANKKVVALFSDSNFIFFLILVALVVKEKTLLSDTLDLYLYVLLCMAVLIVLVVGINYKILYKIFVSKMPIGSFKSQGGRNAYYYISTVSGYIQQWGCISIGTMFLTESELVGFSIVQRFVLPISFVMTICNTYFAPAISRLWDQRNIFKISEVFVRITRLNLIFAALYCLCLWVYWEVFAGAEIMALSVAFVSIMIASQIINVATGMSAVAANMMDLEKDNAIINIISIASFFSVILYFSGYGALGLAMGVFSYQAVKGVAGYLVVRLKRGVKVAALI